MGLNDIYEAEGYVLYDTESDEFLDDCGYTTNSLLDAVWWERIKDAEIEKETLDFPEDFIIKKIHIKYEVVE